MTQFEFGFIGLGDMGSGMAAVLAQAGMRVCGVDPAQEMRDRAAQNGVTAYTDLAFLLANSDTIVISLASMSALANTYDLIAATSAQFPQMIIETSTVAPRKAKELAAISHGSGRLHLEAGMIGLPEDARAARLFYLVGGTAKEVAKAQPFLTVTGRAFAHLGPIGSAATVKTLNNAIGVATMFAFTEAIVAAEALGVDPAAFVSAVIQAGGAGMSVVFERHAARALTTSVPQPPTPINFKDMAELRAMLASCGDGFNLFDTAISIAANLPEHPGIVRAHADMLRAKISPESNPWN